MALKVLGQSNPAATTNTTVYTVATSKSAAVSTVIVCNQSASAGTFRIYVVPGGGAPAAANYIAYDVPIDGNAFVPLTIGITMTATDIIGVQCSSASMSVSVFGDES